MSDLAEARDKGLEDAAKVADLIAKSHRNHRTHVRTVGNKHTACYHQNMVIAAVNIAHAIRELKEKP